MAPTRAQSLPVSPARHGDRRMGIDTAGEARDDRGARASQSLPASPHAINDIDALLKKIEDHRVTAREKTVHFSKEAVATNYTNVLCPNNNDTLEVRLGKPGTALTPIHANYVPLSSTGRYAVGQSPGGEFNMACERDLIHSLDSGRGLFQFTSRNAHCVTVDNDNRSANAMHHEKSLSTVAAMLEAERKKNGGWPKLGDRYQVTKFEVVPSDPPQNDVTRYALTAIDLETTKDTTVFITLAGLRFVDKRLRSEEIARAAELFTAHSDPMGIGRDSDGSVQNGPLICSAAGIGRAAVLAVYQDLCSRMPGEVNVSNLDAHLEEAIKRGIDARGPKFLYSEHQLVELRKALLKKMRNAPAASFGGQSTRQNLHAQLMREIVDPRNNLVTGSDRTNATGHSSTNDSNQDTDAPNNGLASNSSVEGSVGSANPVQLLDTSNQFRNEGAPAAGISPVAVAFTEALDDEHHPTISAEVQNTDVSNPVLPVEDNPAAAPAIPWSAEPTDEPAADPAVVTSLERGNTRHVTSADNIPEPRRSSGLSSTQSEPSIQIYVECLRVLKYADNEGRESLELSPPLMPQQSDAASRVAPLSERRAAALVHAAVARFFQTPQKSMKDVGYRFRSPAQEAAYNDVRERVDMPPSRRVFQALLRPIIENPLESTPHDNFFSSGKMAVYASPEINGCVENCKEIAEPKDEPDGVLNGVPFAPWQAVPTTAQGWNNASPTIAEFARLDDCNAVGAVIVEPDGRAWVVAPTNQRGNKHNTFPTGRIRTDKRLTAQARACKEAYEKLGLQIRLKRRLVDINDGSGTTRYYLAERVGGTPADAGWKSQAVRLVPIETLPSVFTDDFKHSHGHEHVIVESLQQAQQQPTLNAMLIDDQELARLMRSLRSYIFFFTPIHSKKYNYAKDRRFTTMHYFNPSSSKISYRLNAAVENWRWNNLVLLDIVGARPHSAPPNAATVLITPNGSVEPYLHANRIETDGCRIAFIASQRPQTFLVPQGADNKVVKPMRALIDLRGSQPQTQIEPQAVPQTDNSTTFWQTLLNENINVIVDLDDIEGMPREMPYGPQKNAQKRIDTHTLSLSSRTNIRGNLRIEQIEARDENDRVTNVERLHYTAWPDGGVIKPKALINLAQTVVDHSGQPGAKVLVLSTRGVGRAGTLITFIAASEQIAAFLQEHPRHTMTVKKFLSIVMNLVMSGRIERGPRYVDSAQIPLLLAALMKKHFGDNEGNNRDGDSELNALENAK